MLKRIEAVCNEWFRKLCVGLEGFLKALIFKTISEGYDFLIISENWGFIPKRKRNEIFIFCHDIPNSNNIKNIVAQWFK